MSLLDTDEVSVVVQGRRLYTPIESMRGRILAAVGEGKFVRVAFPSDRRTAPTLEGLGGRVTSPGSSAPPGGPIGPRGGIRTGALGCYPKMGVLRRF